MQILERWSPWLTNEGDMRVACDRGWDRLIVETIDAMVEAVKPDGRFAILQIKEKFGGLRIYTFDERLGAIAKAAEERSYRICETCGAPGELRLRRGWHRTACDRHGAGRADDTENRDVRPSGTSHGNLRPAEEPAIDYRLRCWRIVKIDYGTVHLVGLAETVVTGEPEGRVSSAVRSFQRNTGIATTRSQRRYRLVGPKGRHVDADWVLDYWLWLNSARVVDDDYDPDALP